MNPMIPRVRLLLLCGAAAIFCGGLMFALARWNQAELDRAFVEAGALAARQQNAAPAGARFWAPVGGAQPGATVVARITAVEQARTQPAAPPPTAPAGKPPPAAP
jgi:hypothetical protein